MASLDRTQENTRAEIAEYLRDFADELDPAHGGGQTTTTADTGRSADTTGSTTHTAETGTRDRRDRDTDTDGHVSTAGSGEKVTVIAGNESATINPPQSCRFDVSIDTDSDLLDTGAERSATFTIRWSEEHVEADNELRVE